MRASEQLRNRQQWSINAMVSTGNILATTAMLEVLRTGGNAFDAAITGSALLTVVLPMSCGPGGDAALLTYQARTGQVLSFNGLGCAPADATAKAYRDRGMTEIPLTGILSATTPALLGVYRAVNNRLGQLPLERLLAPAVDAAEAGIPVSEQLHRWISTNQAVISADPELLAIYWSDRHAPLVGSILRQPALADLYRRFLANDAPSGFDDDEITHLMNASQSRNGLFAPEDFALPHVRVEQPLALSIGSRTVLTTPLPTQGYLLLQNLWLFDTYRKRSGRSDPNDLDDTIHVLTEIVNQTFGERLIRAGDPDFIDGVDHLLEQPLLEQIYRRLNLSRMSPCRYSGYYSDGDTTHFAVVDGQRNAVSWIQSLGLGFGSGVGALAGGLIFNNRLGRSATLWQQQPNYCVPGKRPVNTIFPYLVLANGALELAGGTPGGDGQAQWNTQFLSARLVDGLSTIDALQLPRWTYFPGSDKIERHIKQQLRIDASASSEVLRSLAERGHELIVKSNVGGVIRVIEAGRSGLYGIDDGRQEGVTAGY